jgi:hypothetical protein
MLRNALLLLLVEQWSIPWEGSCKLPSCRVVPADTKCTKQKCPCVLDGQAGTSQLLINNTQKHSAGKLLASSHLYLLDAGLIAGMWPAAATQISVCMKLTC